MKVKWEGNSPTTVHPVLGKLRNREVFECPDEEAVPYVTSGLLKQVPEFIEDNDPADDAPGAAVEKRTRKRGK